MKGEMVPPNWTRSANALAWESFIKHGRARFSRPGRLEFAMSGRPHVHYW